MKEWDDSSLTAAPGLQIAEVRYSMRDLLAEVRSERTNRALGHDHLSQQAVQSLFKARSTRHGKRRK